MRTIARTQKEYMPVFVTLTYPSVFPLDPAEWKRHLRNFTARLGRRFSNVSGIWKLEPQKRGAPHYHLLVWGVPYEDLLQFVGLAWYQVVGSGDEKHLRAGTRVEKVRTWNGVMSYASKYLGKVPQLQDCPDLWKEVGRYWGVFYRENVPWAEVVSVDVDYKGACNFMRYLRRYGRIRARDYQTLSVICGADFWFDRVHLLC